MTTVKFFFSFPQFLIQVLCRRGPSYFSVLWLKFQRHEYTKFYALIDSVSPNHSIREGGRWLGRNNRTNDDYEDKVRCG